MLLLEPPRPLLRTPKVAAEITQALAELQELRRQYPQHVEQIDEELARVNAG